MTPKAKEDGVFCVCGRNLNYPENVTEKSVICRCERRHGIMKEGKNVPGMDKSTV